MIGAFKRWREIRKLKGQKSKVIRKLATRALEEDFWQAKRIDEEILWVRQQQFEASASRWNVDVPERGSVLIDKGPHYYSNNETRRTVREQIFQRKILWLGVIFGIASVVQAVYAVLDFHLKK